MYNDAAPVFPLLVRFVNPYQQEKSYAFCGVVAQQTIRSRRQRRFDEDITERKIEVTTENLKVFRIDLEHCKHLEKLTCSSKGMIFVCNART